MDSFLGAGFDQKEKTFFRFPHFQQFEKESESLFDQVNHQINDDNPYIQEMLSLIKKHNLQVGLVYDQRKSQATEISKYLERTFNPIVQLYYDDAFLGKPEGNIYFKAKALCKLKANDTLVLDASKNSVLAAYLAHMKGIYLDRGVGVSEKTYKFSYRSIESFQQLSKIIENETSKQ